MFRVSYGNRFYDWLVHIGGFLKLSYLSRQSLQCVVKHTFSMQYSITVLLESKLDLDLDVVNLLTHLTPIMAGRPMTFGIKMPSAVPIFQSDAAMSATSPRHEQKMALIFHLIYYGYRIMERSSLFFFVHLHFVSLQKQTFFPLSCIHNISSGG